ncbi:MAG TPA: peptide-methionine (S)-S-oxide reductase MsrA [Methanothermobacter sp.]|nr:peptide methionine sulfoxide reductase MsrA [Methanothermobacter sp. MT-2]HOK73444.1 peptide-methionine (S)-S-oxide reductase MsrA [Methanothermobacter sp.]HOL68702.1 peptide-methionine (S)-S-oxide reductase MsrA [Methanothermobacter sp.]HPQ05344.1 peptide-methionine (S)-S-oxide reductase MsrA [Methanothermobacter sp.]HPU37770.1 peptide-methionine (S)-S-oxide reductase MsrA [Methanothermobacter sp.]
MGELKKATFGAGCFWGVEAAFRKVEGVLSTVVGYEGGELENPSYEDVCSGTTGHTEVVEVVYDPEKVTYNQLLDVFWSIHDPTTLNRQGPDIGVQYRSVIFYHDKKQKMIAENSKKRLQESGAYPRDIVTAIEPASKFWKAEEYHQQYLEKAGKKSCHF